MKIDNFIGSEFNTPKGGILTVVDTNGMTGSKKRYICECSICSKDEELWPDGSICSFIYNLRAGKTPCGCANVIRYTEEQNLVRSERECLKRGYEFLGWDGDYKGSSTSVKFICCSGHINTTSNLSLFLNKGVGCNKCKGGVLKSDEAIINSFLKTGVFIEGTNFSRNTTKLDSSGKKSHWDVYCPVCSEDKFVKAGLCSGIFTSQRGNLQLGQKPCRCNRYYYTEDQVIFLVKEYLDLSNSELSFIKISEFKGVNSKLEMLCPDHGTFFIDYHHLVQRKQQCRKCSVERGSWRFYKDRLDEIDTLYLLLFTREDEVFIKVGRTFSLQGRLYPLRKHYDVQVLSALYMSHRDVYNKENELHKELKTLHYTPEISFGGSKTECFDVKALNLSTIQECFAIL